MEQGRAGKGEFHPKPLSEPHMHISINTALYSPELVRSRTLVVPVFEQIRITPR